MTQTCVDSNCHECTFKFTTSLPQKCRPAPRLERLGLSQSGHIPSGRTLFENRPRIRSFTLNPIRGNHWDTVFKFSQAGAKITSLCSDVEELATAGSFDPEDFPNLIVLDLELNVDDGLLPFLESLASRVRPLRAHTRAFPDRERTSAETDALLFIWELERHRYSCFDELKTLVLPGQCSPSASVGHEVRRGFPAVALSFDEEFEINDKPELSGEMNSLFSPESWALVDAVEAAERA